LHSNKSSELANLTATTVGSIPTGPTVYPTGTMIKSANSASVYVVTGLLQKTPLVSFSVSSDYGISNYRVVSQTNLDAYTATGSNLNNFLKCGSVKYLANLGNLYEVTASADTMYGYTGATGVAWGSVGCSNLATNPKTLDEYSFIKLENSKTIYYINGGLRHPISSMTKYMQLGGGSDNLLIVSGGVLNTIAEGVNV